ncbi:MAG: hypothetical protein ACK55I_15475, partial [bacterium]
AVVAGHHAQHRADGDADDRAEQAHAQRHAASLRRLAPQVAAELVRAVRFVGKNQRHFLTTVRARNHQTLCDSRDGSNLRVHENDVPHGVKSCCCGSVRYLQDDFRIVCALRRITNEIRRRPGRRCSSRQQADARPFRAVLMQDTRFLGRDLHQS